MNVSHGHLPGHSTPNFERDNEPVILLTPDYFTSVKQPASLVQDADQYRKEAQAETPAELSMPNFKSNVVSLLGHEANVLSSEATEQKGSKKKKKKKKGTVTVIQLNSTSPQPCSLMPCTSPLPPIGVFWDIENCRVPRLKSAMAIVEAIRQKFLIKYREAEFVVVCDTHKERKEIVNELNNAQVTVIHVSCTSKNAADDKLRQCMRRFTENIGTLCAVMLVSSDVNFAVDLSDLKNRRKVQVILLHGPLASEALLLCSNEHHLYDELVESLPFASPSPKALTSEVYLTVSNLPLFIPGAQVRQRVEQIAQNCGGKMVHHSGSRGILRFSTPELAQRAQFRMQGEDVFGCKISVQVVLPVQYSKSVQLQEKVVQQIMANETGAVANWRYFTTFPPPPIPAHVAPPRLLDIRFNSTDRGHPARASVDTRGYNNVLHVDNSRSSQSLTTVYNAVRSAGNWPKTNRKDREVESLSTNEQEIRPTYIPSPLSLTEGQQAECQPVYTTSSSSSSLSISPLQPGDISSDKCSRTSIDLHVTNVDKRVDDKEKATLFRNLFEKLVMVQHFNLYRDSDGRFAATVRVNSLQDARYCVSQLQGYKFGKKKILIAYDHNIRSSDSERNASSPAEIKDQIESLLAEIPQRRIPFSKLQELYKLRYFSSVTLADVCRLSNLNIADDEYGHCTVSLKEGGTTTVQHQQAGHALATSSTCTSSEVLLRSQESVSTSAGQDAWLQAKNRVVSLLYSTAEGSMLLGQLLERYNEKYRQECPISLLVDHMGGVVKIDRPTGSEPIVRFVPLMLLVRQIHILVNEQGGKVLVTDFESLFIQRFGFPCRPADYGLQNLQSLLQAISRWIVISGKKSKKVLMICSELAELIPASVPRDSEIVRTKSTDHWLIKRLEKNKLVENQDTVLRKHATCEEYREYFSSSFTSFGDNSPAGHATATPPLASVLPRPSPNLTSTGNEKATSPIKSRIAAKFHDSF